MRSQAVKDRRLSSVFNPLRAIFLPITRAPRFSRFSSGVIPQAKKARQSHSGVGTDQKYSVEECPCCHMTHQLPARETKQCKQSVRNYYELYASLTTPPY